MIYVRLLQQFVAVAEELHFRRAAERLHMAQPPLSEAIRKLEEALDARRFERTDRREALTPAGAVLLEVGTPHPGDTGGRDRAHAARRGRSGWSTHRDLPGPLADHASARCNRSDFSTL